MGLDLVAFGDRDLAHVVADAGDPGAVAVVPGARRRGPSRRSVAWTSASCQWPTTIFRAQPQPGADEPELAVAVGRLVQVHEVHVDRRPRAGRD